MYKRQGTHYLYCRAYKEESGHTEKYGEWSEGFLLKVNIKTPNAPVSYTHLDVYKRQVLTWGTGNNRVLMSAVNMHGKIRTPFKMPVVKDDKTSNIHIEYEPVSYTHLDVYKRQFQYTLLCDAKY